MTQFCPFVTLILRLFVLTLCLLLCLSVSLTYRERTQMASLIRKSSVSTNSLRNGTERKAVRPAQAHHRRSAYLTAPTSISAMCTWSWQGSGIWAHPLLFRYKQASGNCLLVSALQLLMYSEGKGGKKINDLWLVEGLSIFVVGTITSAAANIKSTHSAGDSISIQNQQRRASAH